MGIRSVSTCSVVTRSAAIAATAAISTLLFAAGVPIGHAGDAAPLVRAFSGEPPGDALPAPWVHRTLPHVKQANRYQLVEDAGQTVLKVSSTRSASTLVHPLDIDPQRWPMLSWRWKVSNVVVGSDFTHKDGDDYAAKVYVLFDYPLERLALAARIRLSLARTLYGQELPAAAITYVWGTAQPAGASGPNAYTGRVQMMVVNSGSERVGEWVDVRRDLGADFEALFGEPAPRIVGIAVGADTDNTRASVTAWFGDVRLEERE